MNAALNAAAQGTCGDNASLDRARKLLACSTALAKRDPEYRARFDLEVEASAIKSGMSRKHKHLSSATAEIDTASAK